MSSGPLRLVDDDPDIRATLGRLFRSGGYFVKDYMSGEELTVQVRGDEVILVVEDNPNVRKKVIRQLRDLGYKSVEADSGASALELVEQCIEFDLLLIDVVMPGGITGYQLADQIRQTRPDLKVLFTSGYTELARSSDQRARKDPLLSKPYRKQDLGRAVRAAIDQPSSTASGQADDEVG